MKDLIKDLKNPGVEFRGKPFWSWNGLLDKEELKRQLRVFKEMGLGGAFMHARTGLQTPYMSEEWLDCVAAVVDEAVEIGMEPWLYDEYGCPSGSGGGMVTRDPAYQVKYMGLLVFSDIKEMPDSDCYALFDVEFRDNLIYSYKRVNYNKNLKLEESHKFFFFKIKSPACNPSGYTSLDTLSAEAVRKFIKCTHDAYAKKFGAALGKIIPGIFTDEPAMGCTRRMMSGGWYRSSWTDKLPAVFKKMHGYDIDEFLPEIYFRTKDEVFSKFKYDYKTTLQYLFVNNFVKQIADWCDKHQIALTGHLIGEEFLYMQSGHLGSHMQTLKHFQIPGIDILKAQGLDYRPGGVASEYLNAKQCASIKEQFGRKWMLSELYGCTGWHMTFADYKAVGDWQAALGVNLRCQHISWYTMEGEAKRDFPASFLHQSPWWKEYHFIEDYFARVNMLLSEGKAVKDIAVIHPVESLWGLFGVCEYDQKENNFWDKSLESIQTVLLEEHFDFDYVDEGILHDCGSVEKGMLKVGKASYNTVVVPPLLNIRKSTFEYLMKFKKSGGNLIFIGQLPQLMDTAASPVLDKAMRDFTALPIERELLSKELAGITNIRRVSIKTLDGREYPKALYQLRYDVKNKRHIIFVCHSSQKNVSGSLKVTLAASGHVYEYDCIANDIYQCNAGQNGGFLAFETSLEPFGSRMFIIEESGYHAVSARAGLLKEKARIAFDSEEWTIMRDEPNAFPLDRPEYSINGSAFEGPLEILMLDTLIRKKFSLPVRGDGMPEIKIMKSLKLSKPSNVRLKYKFIVEEIPSAPSWLVLEKPAEYSISINGAELSSDDDEGWWIDKSFRKIRVPPAYLKTGINELTLKTDYHPLSGFETIYFLGEFGMKWQNGKALVTRLPKSLKIGSWVEQGFPAYSGAITYRNTFKASAEAGTYILEIPDWKGALLKIRVNGADAGIIALPPYKLDISSFVKAGDRNILEIEVISTRKNLLGPLHHTDIYPAWTGFGEFMDADLKNKNYLSLPYGIMKDPYITIS